VIDVVQNSVQYTGVRVSWELNATREVTRYDAGPPSLAGQRWKLAGKSRQGRKRKRQLADEKEDISAAKKAKNVSAVGRLAL